jgi:hypothetical protein
MNEHTEKPTAPRTTPTEGAHAPYDPPRIERVLSPEDLEAEALYGGTVAGASPIEW